MKHKWPRTYDHELSVKKAKKLVADLIDITKPYYERLAYCYIHTKALNRGYRLDIFVSGACDGFYNHGEAGVSQQEWNTLVRSLVKCLKDALKLTRKDIQDLNIGVWCDFTRFNMTDTRYIKYKELWYLLVWIRRCLRQWGTASMCWSSYPTGIFDSGRAIELANSLGCVINEELEQAVSEARKPKAPKGLNSIKRTWIQYPINVGDAVSPY